MEDDASIIVVVDDSYAVRAQFKRSIEKMEREIELKSYSSAAKAFEYLQTVQPKMIFIDILMPDKDGFSFLGQLRQLSLQQSTPVIMISSKDYAQDRIIANELSVLEFVLKPIPMQVIQDIVSKYIDEEDFSF